MHRVGMAYPSALYERDCAELDSRTVVLPSGVLLLAHMLEPQDWLESWFTNQFGAWMDLHCEGTEFLQGCWENACEYRAALPNYAFVLLDADQQEIELAFTSATTAMLWRLTFT